MMASQIPLPETDVLARRGISAVALSQGRGPPGSQASSISAVRRQAHDIVVPAELIDMSRVEVVLGLDEKQCCLRPKYCPVEVVPPSNSIATQVKFSRCHRSQDPGRSGNVASAGGGLRMAAV